VEDSPIGLELAKAFVRVRGDSSQLGGDLNKVKGKVVSSLRGMMTTMNSMLGAMGAAAGAAGFIALLRSGEDFNRKMQNSLAIMGEVSDVMKGKMKSAALDAARATMFSASQSAESYFYLASAGLDAEQSIAALPQVAQFAQAGMFDMARATDLATDAQSALGLTVKDAQKNLTNMTRVTDVLVKANTMANASVEQFSLSITSKGGAAARAAGKDIEELVAVLAAFADQGIKGQEAGTAMNIVLRELKTRSRDNAAAFKKNKIAVFESNGAMRNMADIVKDLESAFGGLEVEQQATLASQLGFQDKSVIFIQTLLGTSEKIRKYEDGMRKAGGITKEVADKQMTPLQKGMAKLGASFAEVTSSIMERMGPAIGAAAAAIGEFSLVAFEGLKKLPAVLDEFNTKFKGIPKLMAAAAASTFVFVGALKAARLASIILGITIQKALIATGIGAIAVAVGLALLTVKELITYLWDLSPVQDELAKNANKFRMAWKLIGDSFKTIGNAILDMVKTISTKFDFLGTSMIQTFGDVVVIIIGRFADMTIKVAEWFSVLVNNSDKTWKLIGAFVEFFVSKSIDLWKNMTKIIWENLKALVKGLVDAWKVGFDNSVKIWQQLGKTTLMVLAAMWTEGLKMGLNFWSKMLDMAIEYFKSLPSMAWESLKEQVNLFKKIPDMIRQVIKEGVTFGADLEAKTKDLAKNMADIIKDGIGKDVDYGRAIADAVKKSGAKKTFSKYGQDWMKALTDPFKQLEAPGLFDEGDRTKEARKQISTLLGELQALLPKGIESGMKGIDFGGLFEKAGGLIGKGIAKAAGTGTEGIFGLLSKVQGLAKVPAAKEKAGSFALDLGKETRFGFAEFGASIQDAIIKRDDPQKAIEKNTKETAKNTGLNAELMKKVADKLVTGMLVGPP